MRAINRRESAKLAAGLATGAGLAAPVRGELPKVKDTQLANAKQLANPYMFAERVTFKASTTEPRSFNLVITSALNEQGVRESVSIRPGTVQVFRADADVDEKTKKGAVHWTCGAAKGTFEFKEPGALVLAVREQDGTVTCYTLVLDFRC